MNQNQSYPLPLQSQQSVYSCTDTDTEIHITCVICGDSFSHLIIKQEVGELGAEKIITSQWTEDESSILSWLLQRFRIKLSKVNSWNCESEPFPFCLRCKVEVKTLLDLQIKLNELRKILKDRTNDLMLKMKLSENTFKCGIYDKDKRYQILRRQILCKQENEVSATKQKKPKLSSIAKKSVHKREEELSESGASVVVTSSSASCENKTESDRFQTTRSGRKTKVVCRYTPCGDNFNTSAPVVMISSNDAKKRKNECNVKTTEIFENPITRKGPREKRKPQVISKSRALKSSRTSQVEDFEECSDSVSKKEIRERFTDGDNSEYSFSNDKLASSGCSDNNDGGGSDANDGVYQTQLDIGTQSKLKTRRPRPVNQRSIERFAKTNLKCEICGKGSFRSRCKLELHRWTHYNEQEKETIIARGEVHHAVKTTLIPKCFQCNECGAEFRRVYNFERHKQTFHGNEEERQRLMELCPHCGKSFMHLRLHIERCNPNKERNFACGICGKTFNDKQVRRRHRIEVHEQLFTFQCTLCPKGYSTKYKFELHMNGHLNIRKFQCDKCPSAFTMKPHLRRHYKIYHEEGGNPKRNTFIRGMTKKTKGSDNMGNAEVDIHSDNLIKNDCQT